MSEPPRLVCASHSSVQAQDLAQARDLDPSSQDLLFNKQPKLGPSSESCRASTTNEPVPVIRRMNPISQRVPQPQNPGVEAILRHWQTISERSRLQMARSKRRGSNDEETPALQRWERLSQKVKHKRMPEDG